MNHGSHRVSGETHPGAPAAGCWLQNHRRRAGDQPRYSPQFLYLTRSQWCSCRSVPPCRECMSLLRWRDHTAPAWSSPPLLLRHMLPEMVGRPSGSDPSASRVTAPFEVRVLRERVHCVWQRPSSVLFPQLLYPRPLLAGRREPGAIFVAQRPSDKSLITDSCSLDFLRPLSD